MYLFCDEIGRYAASVLEEYKVIADKPDGMRLELGDYLALRKEAVYELENGVKFRDNEVTEQCAVPIPKKTTTYTQREKMEQYVGNVNNTVNTGHEVNIQNATVNKNEGVLHQNQKTAAERAIEILNSLPD